MHYHVMRLFISFHSTDGICHISVGLRLPFDILPLVFGLQAAARVMRRELGLQLAPARFEAVDRGRNG